jgi:HK97 gp10 family phage protein
MLDFAAFEATLVEAVTAALDAGADVVLERARHRAPVRKIFGGGRRTMRFKTPSEVRADRSLRKALGLGPEFAAPANAMRPRRYHRYGPAYGRVVTSPDTANTPFRPLERRLTPSGHNLAMRSMEARLSKRGRYELRSGRAAHKGYLGGRLRDEMYVEAARAEGSKISASVVSPTPYAKYQEFGTRHHAAHPFLRPALMESRGEIASLVQRAAGDAARRGIPVTGEPVVVRITLKAMA